MSKELIEHTHKTEPSFSVKIERNSRGYNYEVSAHNAEDLDGAYQHIKTLAKLIEKEHGIPKVGG